MNMQAMLKQAQALQKDMMKAKEEIDNTEFVGESSLVKITMKGTKEVTKVEIQAEELDKDFVFNKYCKANLSKYLVRITREIEVKKSTTRMNNTMAKQRDPNAVDAPIPQEVVLVFLKPSDSLSFTLAI